MSSLQLATLDGCGLAIGPYPRFRYDARGGSGLGELGAPGTAGLRPLSFDPGALSIPPLSWRTTRCLGLPLPPGLRIAIEPERLDGWLDPATGAVSLRFSARFLCSIELLYGPTVLRVDAELSTGPVRSQRHRVQGEPMGADGTALLVGVATVPRCHDPLLDGFLGLPDEALAVLRCRFSPTPLAAASA